jgi:hypothetical protein
MAAATPARPARQDNPRDGQAQPPSLQADVPRNAPALNRGRLFTRLSHAWRSAVCRAVRLPRRGVPALTGKTLFPICNLSQIRRNFLICGYSVNDFTKNLFFYK